jgi:hypothetical protein
VVDEIPLADGLDVLDGEGAAKARMTGSSELEQERPSFLGEGTLSIEWSLHFTTTFYS